MWFYFSLVNVRKPFDSGKNRIRRASTVISIAQQRNSRAGGCDYFRGAVLFFYVLGRRKFVIRYQKFAVIIKLFYLCDWIGVYKVLGFQT